MPPAKRIADPCNRTCHHAKYRHYQGRAAAGATRVNQPNPAAATYTVAVPVFCEAQSLVELADRIEAVFRGRGEAESFEILFVDDGSTDESRRVADDLARERSYVRTLAFRVNQGKSLALMAAFFNARGKYVVTMDADLQNNPEDIPKLVDKLNQGYDIVSGRRDRRTDGLVRRLGSRLFNYVVAKSGHKDFKDLNCGLKIYRKEVFDKVHIYGQLHRYIPLLAHLQGFRVTEIQVEDSARKYGESKYRAIRFEGLFDLLTIMFVSRYGFRPFHLFGKIGMILLVPCAIILTYLVGSHLLSYVGLAENLGNRPLLTFSLIGLMMGLNILLTGFVCDLVLHQSLRRDLRSVVDKLIDDQ